MDVTSQPFSQRCLVWFHRRYVPELKASLFCAGMAHLVVLELSPLLTALLLAGRIGGSFAGEVGTMQATNQNRLLQTLGVSPRRWSLLPTVCASAIVRSLSCNHQQVRLCHSHSQNIVVECALWCWGCFVFVHLLVPRYYNAIPLPVQAGPMLTIISAVVALSVGAFTFR